MRLHIVWIGRTKDRHCAALIDGYLKRMEHFVTLEVGELKEPKGEADKRRVVEAEGARILAAIERDDFVILLDEDGRELSSPELAELIGTKQRVGIKRLAFVIGGFAGVSQKVKDRADLRMALSKMTLTHELARVFLSEQLYRAFTLLAGWPYHKF
ncbi:MAG TPA: 23S rRNA (pseudouridine(1915)-N(3))-methyltransferase RlmH [Blastocatellia bacterium]|nr:23S rRNA (pseudouridine(1915)-N(3))-methyltransferase RlmH [Blastocatellia bacterium]